MRRREFLRLAGAARCRRACPCARRRRLPNWPDRPVKFVIPYAPGGGSDLIGRPWAEKLSQAFGQQFVIENRGGAGGMIGAEAASKAHRRRLHVPDEPQRDADRAAAPAQDALRSQQLPARRPHRRFRHRLLDASRRRSQDLQGDGRLRQGQSRQALLWLGRLRHRHAPAAGDAEVSRRHRHPARALPRQRRCAQRPAAQHRADDERDQQHSAREGGQAAPAQHQSQHAASRSSPTCRR